MRIKNCWWKIRDWLRRLGLFLPPDPVALCVRDHIEDHVCWDDLWDEECHKVWRETPKHLQQSPTETALPGPLCWMCNRCKRLWTTKNPHKPQSQRERERQERGEHIWGEYDTLTKSYGRMPMRPYNEDKLAKKRKERENAESSNR